MYIHNKKAKSGFTLIELLVVIAIIGVLATIVLASLNTARVKSRDARRITDLKQIQIALEIYYDGKGVENYPAAPTAGTCDATHSLGLEVLATNGYIAQIPRDPANPNLCYRYAVGSSGTPATLRYYHLGTILEDATNIALKSDRDCDDSATTAPKQCEPGVALTWTGSVTLGRTDGTAASGGTCLTNRSDTVEQCYDLTP